jgi:putative transposase
VTKYRHKCITKDILERIEEIAQNLFTTWKCEIIEINGEADHIHILFEAPPQVQPSKLINNFKTVSSRYLRKEFSEHLSKFYWKPYFWSQSYLIISTGGATIEVIKKYIEEQNAPQ